MLAGNDGRRSRIYHTAVDPDARGRGIGSMLVGRVVETLRAIGLPKVAVGVPSDNDAGNDFWERQGFAVRPACRPTHGHVGSGGDAAAQRVHYVAQQPRVKRAPCRNGSPRGH